MDLQQCTDSLLQTFCSQELRANDVPRTLMIVAHPDDETIGAGARLPVLRENLLLVYVTDGAPHNMRDARANGFSTRAQYAAHRRSELRQALAVVGIEMDQVMELGIADQQASQNLTSLVLDVAFLMLSYQPQIILTHAYEGGHPDHDATAFAVHIARHMLAAEEMHTGEILEMTSYYNGGNGIAVEDFCSGSGTPSWKIDLDETARERKKRMAGCFVTQRDTLQYFPFAQEQFRHAPHYDFTQPPHEGLLFYELFNWNMKGRRWRQLAQRSLVELGIGH